MGLLCCTLLPARWRRLCIFLPPCWSWNVSIVWEPQMTVFWDHCSSWCHYPEWAQAEGGYPLHHPSWLAASSAASLRWAGWACLWVLLLPKARGRCPSHSHLFSSQPSRQCLLPSWHQRTVWDRQGAPIKPCDGTTCVTGPQWTSAGHHCPSAHLCLPARVTGWLCWFTLLFPSSSVFLGWKARSWGKKLSELQASRKNNQELTGRTFQGVQSDTEDERELALLIHPQPGAALKLSYKQICWGEGKLCSPQMGIAVGNLLRQQKLLSIRRKKIRFKV